METIGEICNRDVVIITKDAAITEAAKLMREYHVGDVIVVEERPEGNVPVGILTDRDIVVELIADGVKLDTVTVGDAMSLELFAAREDEGVCATIEGMRAKRVRRCPVVDARGLLVGIVSVDDLFEYLAEKLEDLTRIAQLQQSRESKVRTPH